MLKYKYKSLKGGNYENKSKPTGKIYLLLDKATLRGRFALFAFLVEFFRMDSYVVTPGGYLKKYTYANRKDSNGGVTIIADDITRGVNYMVLESFVGPFWWW